MLSAENTDLIWYTALAKGGPILHIVSAGVSIIHYCRNKQHTYSMLCCINLRAMGINIIWWKRFRVVRPRRGHIVAIYLHKAGETFSAYFPMHMKQLSHTFSLPDTSGKLSNLKTLGLRLRLSLQQYSHTQLNKGHKGPHNHSQASAGREGGML